MLISCRNTVLLHNFMLLKRVCKRVVSSLISLITLEKIRFMALSDSDFFQNHFPSEPFCCEANKNYPLCRYTTFNKSNYGAFWLVSSPLLASTRACFYVCVHTCLFSHVSFYGLSVFFQSAKFLYQCASGHARFNNKK